MLQFDGHHPFLELGEDGAYLAVVLAGEEVLGQLLGDGAAAAAAALAADEGLEEDAHKAAGVDARVLVETHILGGDEGVDQMGRELVVGHVGAVLQTDEAENLAVGRDDLGGLVALGVLQFLEGGHESQPPQGEKGEEEEDEYPHARKDFPCDADGAVVLCASFLCHNSLCFIGWAISRLRVRRGYRHSSIRRHWCRACRGRRRRYRCRCVGR